MPSKKSTLKGTKRKAAKATSRKPAQKKRKVSLAPCITTLEQLAEQLKSGGETERKASGGSRRAVHRLEFGQIYDVLGKQTLMLFSEPRFWIDRAGRPAQVYQNAKGEWDVKNNAETPTLRGPRLNTIYLKTSARMTAAQKRALATVNSEIQRKQEAEATEASVREIMQVISTLKKLDA